MPDPDIAAQGDPSVTLPGLLELEQVGDDEFRTTMHFADLFRSMFGGQTLAQALLAAGLTVEPGRVPHSMHAYFLARGSSSEPTTYTVRRTRDGGTYSARHVEATQDGRTLLTAMASFHTPHEGWEEQARVMPATTPPAGLPGSGLFGLASLEGRIPEQRTGTSAWPSRFWARVTDPLKTDPLTRACAIAYISDISYAIVGSERGSRTSASVDHALWFHRLADLGEWVLIDYEAGATIAGRSWYSGTIWDERGAMLATLGQEMLYR